MKSFDNPHSAANKKRSLSFRRMSRGRAWLVVWLSIAAVLVGRSLWPASEAPLHVANSSRATDLELSNVSLKPSPPKLTQTFRAIEQLRVGDRVVADNPDVDTPEQTAVDPATWRLVKLYAEDRWPDGTFDTIHIQSLQPPLRLELFEVAVGTQVPPPLDLVEMGLPADLATTVVAVEPCPELRPGPGRVVLTTVNHLNDDVWELSAENAAHQRETLRPTGSHKFYSETRRTWVSTKQIHDNEVIRGRAGPLTIVARHPLPGTQRVYNLTVEGEHVYYVSELGLLAHNTCSAGAAGDAVARRAYLNAKFGRSGNLNADINARGIDNAIQVNARLATDYARIDRNLQRIGGTPQAFGTRAHKYFRRLNNRLSNRAAGTYRVATEQFRDTLGRVLPPRRNGTIGADVLYTIWNGSVTPTIYDLKTYTTIPRAISTARQNQFLVRFGANAQEIYVRQ